DMRSAVPDVFNHIDAFASHSYPARGFGWGFFVPYSEAGVGLRVFESEIAEIGRPDIEVFLTETGWCEPHPDERMRRCTENGGSREQIAVWTEEAYRNFWLVHPRLRAIMPFILRVRRGMNSHGWIQEVRLIPSTPGFEHCAAPSFLDVVHRVFYGTRRGMITLHRMGECIRFVS
ncbi:MAG: hypothetical protein N2515_09555, partial [Deltaproteobacteria bacterium]|nr:hypothetical protein [Deltaproteobacteria bacterium]